MSPKKSLIHAVVDINHEASKYESSIVLITGSRVIDVKSMLGLSNSILNSEEYKLEIYGSDEEAAKQAMRKLFAENGLVVTIN
ncbi:HPr family phosphocarrier protein [Virgibacillus sp. 7505]|uniref:HPr family phosphocarrier protein n=1 Tax=Virgibacillus sp. 7505 TaxID=2022548 RepID=UPI0025711808|nr:HPr family phosphocarrier protein [Virgibacillus sp. 7505]